MEESNEMEHQLQQLISRFRQLSAAQPNKPADAADVQDFVVHAARFNTQLMGWVTNTPPSREMSSEELCDVANVV